MSSRPSGEGQQTEPIPTLRQADTLRAMVRHQTERGEWPTLIELGELCRVTNQTIGQRLRSLARGGWVERLGGPKQHHRGWRATDKGLKYVDHHRNWGDFWAEVVRRQAEFDLECADLKRRRGVYDTRWDGRRQTFTGKVKVFGPITGQRVGTQEIEIEGKSLEDLGAASWKAGWRPDEDEDGEAA